MTNADTARKCFQENLDRFGPARSEPEKYNLYNGLARLAEAIASIEAQVQDLAHRIRKIERG